MRNNACKLNEIIILNFSVFSFFDHLTELKFEFLSLPINDYLTMNRKYSFLALFLFVTIKMYVAKIFHFRYVLS